MIETLRNSLSRGFRLAQLGFHLSKGQVCAKFSLSIAILTCCNDVALELTHCCCDGHVLSGKCACVNLSSFEKKVGLT